MAAPAPRRRGRGTQEEEVVPPRSEVEKRIDHVVFLMIKGRWYAGSLRRYAAIWGVSERYAALLVEQAQIRVQTASGKVAQRATQGITRLDAVYQIALERGDLVAATRAIDIQMRIAGVYRPKPTRAATRTHRPQGLPPELALVPPPTREEVEHYAATPPEDCTLEICRVHQRPPAGAGGSAGGVH